MNLEKKVIAIISHVIKTPESQLTAGAGLYRVAGWDSLCHITLVIELENVFDIAFEFDELDKIVTVEAIINSLKEKGVAA